MRIGLGLEMDGTIDEIVARARVLASTGVVSLWSSQIFGWDTLTVLAIVGREVPGIDLGTAVIPVHPRHPMMLAEQALTVQGASGGRFVLGIGLSHQVVVEGAWGYSFDKPARYMREYLSVLVPLLHGEQVSFNGEVIRTNTFGPLDVAPTTPPPVLVAALGPTMLRQAGSPGRRHRHVDGGPRHRRRSHRAHHHRGGVRRRPAVAPGGRDPAGVRHR